MLLRLACPPDDWIRLAAALDAAGSPILANVVRYLLVSASPAAATDRVPLAFTPAQAGALQRVAASINLSLPATPIFDQPDPVGWVTSAAERAAAVATADAIVRGHKRLRFTYSASLPAGWLLRSRLVHPIRARRSPSLGGWWPIPWSFVPKGGFRGAWGRPPAM